MRLITNQSQDAVSLLEALLMENNILDLVLWALKYGSRTNIGWMGWEKQGMSSCKHKKKLRTIISCRLLALVVARETVDELAGRWE